MSENQNEWWVGLPKELEKDIEIEEYTQYNPSKRHPLTAPQPTGRERVCISTTPPPQTHYAQRTCMPFSAKANTHTIQATS